MFLHQTPTPFIVEIIRPPVEEQSVAGLLINALGLAGALAVAAVPLGLVVGFFLIRWNRRRPPEADHMPHVSPSFQTDDEQSSQVNGRPGPPSDQAR